MVLATASGFLSFGLFISLTGEEDASRAWMAGALLLVHNVALVWRRSAPWQSLAVNLLSGIGLVMTGFPTVVLQLAPLVSVYSAASRIPRWASAWALAAGLGALAVTEVFMGGSQRGDTIIGNVIGIALAWIAGTVVFDRQSYVEKLEVRTHELQAAREELAQRAVAEERMRIARELHDVVAHSLSLIAVQSGMGAHVIKEQPEEAERALAAIRETSAGALSEMRRLLGVLREEGVAASSEPLAGSDRLDELVAQVSSTGLNVSVHRHGRERALPVAIDLTVYRIVQESLTNVVKHARATNARVTLTYADDRVAVEVVDDGRAPQTKDVGAGHGLAGMRERISLFGGTLEAGPMAEGGFRVRALLPLEVDAA